MARRGPDVEVVGLADFRRELAKLEPDSEWNKEFARTHRDLAQEMAGLSRSRAAGMGGQQAHFAAALTGTGNASAARVQVGGARTPKGKYRANPAFWGRKSQGNWIGTSWDVGGPGGPYAINDTIAANGHRIDDAYGRLVDRTTRGAF